MGLLAVNVAEPSASPSMVAFTDCAPAAMVTVSTTGRAMPGLELMIATATPPASPLGAVRERIQPKPGRLQPFGKRGGR